MSQWTSMTEPCSSPIQSSGNEGEFDELQSRGPTPFTRKRKPQASPVEYGPTRRRRVEGGGANSEVLPLRQTSNMTASAQEVSGARSKPDLLSIRNLHQEKAGTRPLTDMPPPTRDSPPSTPRLQTNRPNVTRVASTTSWRSTQPLSHSSRVHPFRPNPSPTSPSTRPARAFNSQPSIDSTTSQFTFTESISTAFRPESCRGSTTTSRSEPSLTSSERLTQGKRASLGAGTVLGQHTRTSAAKGKPHSHESNSDRSDLPTSINRPNTQNRVTKQGRLSAELAGPSQPASASHEAPTVAPEDIIVVSTDSEDEAVPSVNLRRRTSAKSSNPVPGPSKPAATSPECIDLTLDDDDSVPPVPARRIFLPLRNARHVKSSGSASTFKTSVQKSTARKSLKSAKKVSSASRNAATFKVQVPWEDISSEEDPATSCPSATRTATGRGLPSQEAGGRGKQAVRQDVHQASATTAPPKFSPRAAQVVPISDPPAGASSNTKPKSVPVPPLGQMGVERPSHPLASPRRTTSNEQTTTLSPHKLTPLVAQVTSDFTGKGVASLPSHWRHNSDLDRPSGCSSTKIWTSTRRNLASDGSDLSRASSSRKSSAEPKSSRSSLMDDVEMARLSLAPTSEAKAPSEATGISPSAEAGTKSFKIASIKARQWEDPIYGTSTQPITLDSDEEEDLDAPSPEPANAVCNVADSCDALSAHTKLCGDFSMDASDTIGVPLLPFAGTGDIAQEVPPSKLSAGSPGGVPSLPSASTVTTPESTTVTYQSDALMDKSPHIIPRGSPALLETNAKLEEAPSHIVFSAEELHRRQAAKKRDMARKIQKFDGFTPQVPRWRTSSSEASTALGTTRDKGIPVHVPSPESKPSGDSDSTTNRSASPPAPKSPRRELRLLELIRSLRANENALRLGRSGLHVASEPQVSSTANTCLAPAEHSAEQQTEQRPPIAPHTPHPTQPEAPPIVVPVNHPAKFAASSTEGNPVIIQPVSDKERSDEMEVDIALSEPSKDSPATPPAGARKVPPGFTYTATRQGRTQVDVVHFAANKQVTVPPRSFQYNLDAVTHDMAYLLNHPAPHRLAKDIPRRIQKFMGAMLPYVKSSKNAKHTFEAMILKNTTQDERNAPPIQIINNIDDEGSTPLWEFHYSNEMWYDRGVPPPNYDGVVGCGCVGQCDPTSPTCSCVRRQERWTNSPSAPEHLIRIPGFAYDSKGCLEREFFKYPVFECNWKCGCDEDCPNRVVQNGRKCSVHIVKTKKKGWGIFAGSDPIPEGTFLGIYAGELLTTETAESRGLEVYNALGRTYVFDVDFWHLKDPRARMEGSTYKNLPKNYDEDEDWDPMYSVDAFHVGNFTRFLNHSCDPNVFINPVYVNDADFDKPLFCMFTSRAIKPYEELSFSYTGDDDDDSMATKNDGAGNSYGKCECGARNCKGIMFS